MNGSEIIDFETEEQPKALLLNSDREKPITVSDISRQEKIKNVMRLVVYDGMTISLALSEMGVPGSTWASWQSAGYIQPVTEQILAESTLIAQSIVIPKLEEMYRAMLNLAIGLPPENNPSMDVKPTHIIAAQKFLHDQLGIVQKPTTKDDVNDNSIEVDQFLNDYKPIQVINFNQVEINQFLYNGNHDIELPPVPDHVIELDDE